MHCTIISPTIKNKIKTKPNKVKEMLSKNLHPTKKIDGNNNKNKNQPTYVMTTTTKTNSQRNSEMTPKATKTDLLQQTTNFYKKTYMYFFLNFIISF